LLQARDSPLGMTHLGEQADREDDAEQRAPADIEDRVPLLVDETRETVDEVDDAEVQRQEGERKQEGHESRSDTLRSRAVSDARGHSASTLPGTTVGV
jgi:hypothetical protein